MTQILTGVAGATPALHPDIPVRAAGVELLGELDGSGYREPPFLARRADGQTIQLTSLLYRVLEAIDGRRDLDGIAAAVSARIGKQASRDDVGFLIDEKLRPLGLLRCPDGSEPEVQKANPLLALRWRVVLSDERTTRRVTAPFAPLFAAPIVLGVIALFGGTVGWLLFSEGVAGATRRVLYSPGLVVLTFALAAASAGFHEFGHAAALRYSGGRPGVMGAGLYLVWPAFYTDVTDSYRLPRSGRLRTDLGGLYFNMVFAVAAFAVWALTGLDALLLVIPLLLFQMIQQLLPFVRLDGYHILADLTGVPDLFARIRPTLLSLWPGRRPDPRVTALKPWVRVVVTAWVVAVIPLLALALLFAVVNLPRLVATAWDSVLLQWQTLGSARGDGRLLAMAAAALSIGALCLLLLSTVYLLSRIARRGGRAAWQSVADRPARRAGAVLAGTAAVIGLAWLWWPNGEYRPFQPGERARVQDTVRAGGQLRSGRPGLTAADRDRFGGAPFRSTDTGRSEVAPDPAGTPTTSTTTAGSEPTTTTTATAVAGTDTPASSTTTTARSATTTTAPASSTTTTTVPDVTTTTNPTTTESTQP
jgi:putative peptide zinc metalloprotease protein